MSPDIERLSLWQVERALASLSDGEKFALMKIARLYARKTPYDKEDLVQEAFARVLSGRRAWIKGYRPGLVPGGSYPQHCLGMEERGAAGRDTLDGLENRGAQCQCRHRCRKNR